MKKKYFKLVSFLLAIVMILTNILSSFPEFTLQAEAAQKYTLYSRNAKYNGLAIKELGHSETTPFRFFKMNTDDGVKKVFCGYSEGRGHEGDSYTKKVVNAKDWESAGNNALFGKHTTSIAKALIYYYDVIGPSNASDFLQTVLQTYIWARSMGRDDTKALKQLANSLGVKYNQKIAPIIEEIKNTPVYGQIEIYSHVGKCVGSEGQNLTHQPYYRWIGTEPVYGSVSASSSRSKNVGVDISLLKFDGKSKKPVPNTKIRIETTNANGSKFSKDYTTDKDGMIQFNFTRTYSASATSDTYWYVTNWDQLGIRDKEKLSKQGKYQNRTAAYQAAKAQADSRAQNNLNAIKIPNYNWTFTEISSPGHYFVKDKSSVTKVQTPTTAWLSVQFSNAPKSGSIKITKKPTTQKYNEIYSVAGAKYELVADENMSNLDGTDLPKGTVVKTITIPKSGEVTVNNLPIGKYILREIEAPEGFEKDTETHSVTVPDDSATNPTTPVVKTVNVSLKETPKNGSVSFVKYKGTKEDHEPEQGIEFELKGMDKLADGTYYSQKQVTGEDGSIEWTNVPYGHYTLTQVTEQDDSYALYPQTFTIDDEHKNITFPEAKTIDYTKEPGKVMIQKVTTRPLTGGTADIAEDGSFPIMRDDEEGAVFEIKQDDTVVQELTTDKYGFAVSDKLEPGEYTLHQKTGTIGYDKVEDQTFTITAEDTENIRFYLENPRNGTYLEIEKTKVPRTPDAGYEEELPEENAEFYVLDMDKISKDDLKDFVYWDTDERIAFVKAHQDAVIGEKMVTDKSGKASMYFPAGYELTEKGYVILQTKGEDEYKLLKEIYSTDDEVSKVMKGSLMSCAYKGQNIGKFYYALAKVQKTKVIDGNGNTAPEAGATFQLIKSDGTVFGEYTTNENGEFYIPSLLQDDYYLKQISGSKYHESLALEESDIYVVSQDCVIEEDRMQRFIDSGYDESLLSEEEKASLKNLTYQLENKAKPAYIKIEKHATDTDILLNDAVFEVYKKTANGQLEKVTTLTTGACPDDATEEEKKELLGKVECELEYGTYVIREVDAPYGYLLTEQDTGIDSKDENFKHQEIEFTIDEAHVTKDKNGNIVYMASDTDKENGTTFRFKDKVIMGKIKINKVGQVITEFADIVNGFDSQIQALEGATFALYAAEDIRDDAGNLIHAKDSLIDTKVSDSEGNITFTRTDTYTGETTDQFFMGNYYIKELSAPEGYVIENGKYDVTLTCDGTASKINDLTENEGDPDGDQDVASSHGQYFLTTGPTLNAKIKDATKVVFTHITAPSSVTKTDVSADKDGSVMMWKSGTTYFISSQKADQVIYFNINSSEMFKDCTSLTEIVFSNIDTSYMAYAKEMFMNLRSMTKLDLSNLNTGRLTNTVSMFQGSNLLKTIYVGNETQNSPDEEEPTITGIAAYPANSRYFYFDPNAEGITQDDKDINKFQAEDFDFVYLYSDSSADEIPITDEDIESISPTYPYFDDGKTKAGELEVTITIKADSPYAIDHKETELNVKVNVVDPATLDFSPVTEEHPEVSVVSNNSQKMISAVVRKVSKKNPDVTLSGAVFTITAATTLVNKAGEVILEKGDAVTTINSLDEQTGDGGDACAPNLPTGLYAQDPDAEYLYEIRETTAPAGYKKTDDVAYIPNIDMTKAPDKNEMERLASTSDDITAEFIEDGSGTYGTYEFSFTFADELCPTIKKDWTNVPEWDRPDSLTINVYSDAAKKNRIKVFTLTAENDWTAEWPDMPSDDITDFTFEEVIPSGVSWKEANAYIAYPADHPTNPNTVWFSNEWTNIVDVPVTVQKVWDDANDYDKIRPDSVLVTLLRNGEPVEGYINVTLNAANGWKYTTNPLPVYDENEYPYEYTWEEDKSEGSPNLEFLTGDEITGYVDTVVTNGRNTTITNTHRNIINAEVQKVWDDNDDHFQVRPDSINVSLYGDGVKVEEFELETTDKTTGATTVTEIKDGNVTLTADTDWKAKAIHLLKTTSTGKTIQYEWRETEPKYYSGEAKTELLGEDKDDPYFLTTLTNTCTVEYGKVRVEKRIDKKVYDYMKEKPTFSFTLTGTDMYGQDFKETKQVSFADPSKVSTYVTEGYVAVSTEFTDLEMGTYYLSEDDHNVFIWDHVTAIEGGVLEKDKDGNPVVKFDINVDNSSGTMKAAFKNLPNQGKLKVVKHDGDGTTPLEGVTFVLKGKTGTFSKTLTTDANGEVVFDEVPCGDYTITEIKTVKGHSLLTEPVDVTLPLALTKEEMTEKKVDVSKALYSERTGKYHLYSLTYDVTDHANLVLPQTGMADTFLTYLPMITGLLVLILGSVYLTKKGKENDIKEG